jgi:Xaa-Pro aminopeptidase
LALAEHHPRQRAARSSKATIRRSCRARSRTASKSTARLRAHLQDGAAMVEFLCWLDQTKPGTVTEIAVVEKLEAARATVGQRMQNPLKDISFDTISGAGEHAAIMHYRVTTESNRKLEAGELFLIDSGAQYINGTTDITRTVGIGPYPKSSGASSRWFSRA